MSIKEKLPFSIKLREILAFPYFDYALYRSTVVGIPIKDVTVGFDLRQETLLWYHRGLKYNKGTF